MKYSFSCPATCNFEITVGAKNKDEAVAKIVAVSTGTLSSGFIAGLTGNVTTAPMALMPLVLIPAFFVPLFIMFHIAALLQARRHLLPERSRVALR